MNIDDLLNVINELTTRIEKLESQRGADIKDLYTVPEVAKILGLTREGVYHMIKRGEIPVIKLGSLKVRAVDLNQIITGR